MACETQFYDLGRVKVFYNSDNGLVCQLINGLYDPAVSNCYGQDAVFINGDTGLPATFQDVAACYGVVVFPPPPPGQPPAPTPDQSAALQRILDAVNAVSEAVTAVQQQLQQTIQAITDAVSADIAGVGSELQNSIAASTTQIEAKISQTAADTQAAIAAQTQAVVGAVDATGHATVAAIQDAASATDAAIGSVATTVSQSVGAATTSIDNTVSGIGKDITSALSTLATQIDTTITDVGNAIAKSISDTLNSLLPGLLDTLAANTSALAHFVSGLESNLMDGSDLAALATKTVGDAMLGPLNPLKAMLTGAVTKPFQAFLDAGEDVLGPLLDPVIDVLLANEDVPESVKPMLRQLRARPHFWFLILLIPLISEVSKDTFGAALEPFMAKMQQGFKALAQPNLPPLAELLQAERRNLAIPGGILSQAHRSGWPDWAVEIADNLTLTRLTPREYVELWFRDYLSDNQLAQALQAISFAPGEIQNLVDHSKFIPMPQDVIRFLLRDVYFPEFVQRFGMDDMFDLAWATAEADFKHVGVSREVALNFWRAHWELPSITEAFRMYHRVSADGLGDAVTLPDNTQVQREIGRDDLDRLLRAQGIEPFWREPLVKTAFNPITRIDLRRGLELGVLTFSDVYAGYVNLGYGHDDARTLANIAQAVADHAAGATKEPWKASTRTKVITAYEAGEITESHLAQFLSDAGYTEGEVQDAIRSGNTVRNVRSAASVISSVKRLFVAGDWTEAQAATRLRASGLGDTEITTLLADWSLDAEFRIDSARHSAHKEATKAEVLAGYKEGIITRQEASTMLAAIGVPASESQLVLSLADHQIAKANLSAETAAIHAEFIAGHKDLTATTAALDALQMSDVQRGALLQKWEVEIAGKAARLPLSEIKSLVLNGLFTDAQTTAMLRLERYSENDIGSLLALWHTEESTAAQKAKALAARRAAAAAKAAAAAAAKAAKAATPKRKDLTAAEVAKAVVDGFITVDTALTELTEMGYSATDAAIYLAEKNVIPASGILETEASDVERSR